MKKQKIVVCSPDLKFLTQLTGQLPKETYAKSAISNFNIRKGQKMGSKVTLRGRAMQSFLQKFVGILVPANRQFRGLRRNMKGDTTISFCSPDQIYYTIHLIGIDFNLLK